MDTASLPMLTKVLDEHLSVPWAGDGDLHIAETNAVDTGGQKSSTRGITKAQEQQPREDLVRQLAASKRNDLDEMLPRRLTGWRWILPGRRKKLRRLIREYRLIAASPLFDSQWYLAKNPDVALTLLEDPALHYLTHGGLEGRAPGPHFDGGAYLQANPDVANSQSNPLLHYILKGHKENRRITCVGNDRSERYPDTYSEVAAADVKPDATLANAFRRVEGLERRAAILESALELETGRIDWALGSVEGVTAQIDAYHAYRETEQYRAAYAINDAACFRVRGERWTARTCCSSARRPSIRVQSYRNLQIVCRRRQRTPY